MIARVATIRTAGEIWSDATWGDEEKKADAPTRVIWVLAGVAGSVCFFGSFAFLAMPLLYNWSWLAAGAGFIATQYISQILLDLHHYWVKATAFLWIGWRLTKGDVKEQLLAKSHLWGGPREIVAPAKA
jgi:hypothetical protein